MAHVVTGLDVGTTKITTIIASVRDDEQVDIIGAGQVISRGLEHGMVVNLEETVNSIAESVHRAETIAGVEVDRAYVSIAGEHVQGINSNAAIPVGRERNEITPEDVQRVLQNAQAINMPSDLRIIHVFPQGYTVNGMEHVRNPVGLAGSRLEGEVYIVRGSSTAMQNIERAVERAGVEVAELVLQPLASSMAVLEQDQMDMGVAMIDVGGGTTDIAVFVGGSIIHTAVVGVGGQNVTSDIAIKLSVPMLEAKRLKETYAYAMANLVDDDEEITPGAGLGGRKVRPFKTSFLAEIVESQMEEIFSVVWREIERAKLDKMLASGVVLTGGGAMLRGATELARSVFGLEAELGEPMGVVGLTQDVLTPVNATGVGLVLYGATQELHAPREEDQPEADDSSGGKGMLGTIGEWLKDFFTG